MTLYDAITQSQGVFMSAVSTRRLVLAGLGAACLAPAALARQDIVFPMKIAAGAEARPQRTFASCRAV